AHPSTVEPQGYWELLKPNVCVRVRIDRGYDPVAGRLLLTARRSPIDQAVVVLERGTLGSVPGARDVDDRGLRADGERATSRSHESRGHDHGQPDDRLNRAGQ